MSEPHVTVPLHCDRTGKTHTATIPLAQYVLFSKQQRGKRDNAERLRGILLEMGAEAPDLVLYYNGTFVAFPQIVVKSSRVLLRCLNEVTKSTLFPYQVRTRKSDADGGTRE